MKRSYGSRFGGFYEASNNRRTEERLQRTRDEGGDTGPSRQAQEDFRNQPFVRVARAGHREWADSDSSPSPTESDIAFRVMEETFDANQDDPDLPSPPRTELRGSRRSRRNAISDPSPRSNYDAQGQALIVPSRSALIAQTLRRREAGEGRGASKSDVDEPAAEEHQVAVSTNVKPDGLRLGKRKRIVDDDKDDDDEKEREEGEPARDRISRALTGTLRSQRVRHRSGSRRRGIGETGQVSGRERGLIELHVDQSDHNVDSGDEMPATKPLGRSRRLHDGKFMVREDSATDVRKK